MNEQMAGEAEIRRVRVAGLLLAVRSQLRLGRAGVWAGGRWRRGGPHVSQGSLMEVQMLT